MFKLLERFNRKGYGELSQYCTVDFLKTNCIIHDNEFLGPENPNNTY